MKRLRRRFDLYLKDILRTIERVQEYVSSMDIEEFAGSSITVDAVLRNLEVIGEAATQLPEKIMEKYPEVPWRDVQDFRIVVAHHYWKVNVDRVWDIVENKLETLKRQASGILEKEAKRS